MRLPEPPLLVISDRSQARRPLPEIAAAAFAGGGQIQSEQIHRARGHAERPLSETDLFEKFRACLDAGHARISPEEAMALLKVGADYVTLSPIFLTESKPGYGPALGLDAVRAASSAAAGPVIALAGIDGSNAAECITAGASGIAVMGEIMRAADPEAITRGLIQAIARRA